MKQLYDKNILPFYGISMAVSEFCLVFPWYENGGIMDYLEKNQDIKQFKLASMLGHITDSQRLPACGNSYWVQLTGCASCTTLI